MSIYFYVNVDFLPDGFHVPTQSEIADIVSQGEYMSAWSKSDGKSMSRYLKIPYAGYLSSSDGKLTSTSALIYAGDTTSPANGYYLEIDDSSINRGTSYYISKTNGLSVRGVKNVAVSPDETRTTIYSSGSNGIFWNEGEGIITIKRSTILITLMDKNVGATTVYNYGDALTEENCGKYFQRGNCNGFPRTGATKTSATQVDASGYRLSKGKPYVSSTFITGTKWDTSDNMYLWS